MFSVGLPDNLAEKIQALEDYEKVLPEYQDAMARNAAFYFRRHVKSAIRQQSYDWQELSEDWKKEKEERGYDPRIWLASGLMRRNMKVTNRGFADYRLEVSPSVKYENGAEVQMVMYVLEFGSIDGHVPARPLFRPTKKIVRERLITEARAANQRILRALTKDYNLNNVSSVIPDWSGD